MLEIFCVIEDRANDDFLFLLRRDPEQKWGGIAVDAPPGEPVGASLSRALSRLDVLRSWPLCDRDTSGEFEAAALIEGAERRDPERAAITHVGAQIDGDLGKLTGDGWTVVPFDEGLELVEERNRRVLTLARHGAWIHKVGEIEA